MRLQPKAGVIFCLELCSAAGTPMIVTSGKMQGGLLKFFEVLKTLIGTGRALFVQ